MTAFVRTWLHADKIHIPTIYKIEDIWYNIPIYIENVYYN